jgi:hypothetical protein
MTEPLLDLALALEQSGDVLRWVHSNLDGLKVQQIQDSKRATLAAGCWHVAIEHGQAVVVLVHEGLYGSALALIRPLFEAYIRGMWLMHAASDDGIDRAGRDDFPNNINKLVSELEASGKVGMLSELKKSSWNRLCSFTHTGYQQIGARLTTSGLGYGYQRDELLQALAWADGIAFMTVVAFANMTDNEPLATKALEQMRARASDS